MGLRLMMDWLIWDIKKHYRISHGDNEFANGRNHINGIENFWGIAKARLNKFRGLSKKTFYLHLKECEFRFNYRNEDLYKYFLHVLTKILSNFILI